MLDFVKEVKIIGCGGIAAWLVPPLIRFLNANKFAGAVSFWDGDKFEMKNGDRQEINDESLNRNKAEIQAEKYRLLFPGMQFFAYNEFVVEKNITRCIKEDDLVFSCVDNHPCRVLIARRADGLKDVCVISAGNDLMDGNAHVTLRRKNKALTKTMLDRHPDILEVKDGDRAELGCEALIEEGQTQLLVTNFMAAGVALMAFHSLWIHGMKHGKKKLKLVPNEVFFDITQCAVQVIGAE